MTQSLSTRHPGYYALFWVRHPIRALRCLFAQARIRCIDDEIAYYHRNSGLSSATATTWLRERDYLERLLHRLEARP